jgi:ubiquinone/menaquinone biosynthesis C-methylase UbiE
MATIERIPDLFASIYEKATRMVLETYYDPVAEEVVSFLRDGTILDLGTGPGYLPIRIAKKSPSIRIDGIDLGQKLIAMARANAIKAGVSDRVNFEVGNAGKLRFEDDSYDMVLSTGMLHALNDPVGVLRECYRVLKPGGETWIYDPARVSSYIDKKKYLASLSFKEKIISLLFRFYTKFNPPHSYNKEKVSGMIDQTDFKEYCIEEKGKEIRIQLTK